MPEQPKQPFDAKLFEKNAIAQAFQPPTLGDVDAGDEALLAMLAGSTAQSLRNTRINATGAEGVLDPRVVVNGLRKAPAGIPGIPVPMVPGIIPTDPAVLPVPASLPSVDEPQMELGLFRKMDMTDVYHKLDEMHSTLAEIRRVQGYILEFMKRVESS